VLICLFLFLKFTLFQVVNLLGRKGSVSEKRTKDKQDKDKDKLDKAAEKEKEKERLEREKELQREREENVPLRHATEPFHANPLTNNLQSSSSNSSPANSHLQLASIAATRDTSKRNSPTQRGSRGGSNSNIILSPRESSKGAMEAEKRDAPEDRLERLERGSSSKKTQQQSPKRDHSPSGRYDVGRERVIDGVQSDVYLIYFTILFIFFLYALSSAFAFLYDCFFYLY
jgi:hypothetical protein